MAMEMNQVLYYNYLHMGSYYIAGCVSTNTASPNCSMTHLQGKKQNTKENEVAAEILNPSSTPIRLCQWLKPNFGWVKLNTDGSVKKESAGIGGLLRDHMGRPICTFVAKSVDRNVLLVELSAIGRGLLLLLRLGISTIWVESDCLSAVMMINKEVPPLFEEANVYVKLIQKLLLKFNKYQITHSWRETNRAADHLSKMILWKKDVVLWPIHFPYKLWRIIKEDAEGKKYIRR